MEANRITEPRQRPMRAVANWLRALYGRHDGAGGAGPQSAQPAGVADAGAASALPPHTGDVPGVPEETTGAVDFLVHIDLAQRFLYVSDTSLRFAGYHRAFLDHATLQDLVATTDIPRVEALLARAGASGVTEKDTVELMKSLTYPVPVELHVRRAPYAGRDGYAIAGFDVSAWRDAEQRLLHALHHDPLTGLPNPAALATSLERAQAASDAEGKLIALVVLDLDDYQRVNRALGYDAGDEMLRETGRRLAQHVHPGAMISHNGSDEFAILIEPPPHTAPADVRADTEALALRLLAAILQPYTVGDQPVHLSASIGIAFYPDLRDGADETRGRRGMNPLIRRADQALLKAKAAGGNQLMLHVPDDDSSDAERLKLESDLYDGVRNGEFSLHFQPITTSATGGVVGVEALIRWQHPVHGLVPPSTFIPLAESVGLINYLGNWVLKAACMQVVQWDAQGISLQYIAVNVSPQQFRNVRFKESVQEALTLSGIDPRRLVFEITESLLMQDPEHATMLLEELAALGIRFAVDDFGTGYSSLAYLQRFPLSKLKIDRSFVENLLTSQNDQAIVSAVVGLARTLGLELVAEGVETPEQRELLKEMGCDHIQGWLVCKALPSEELARRFESHSLHVQEAH